ncbi:MAG TPA: flippase [Candidatus Nanoarchaeia archaeon]|nr:flippase [Candidatus Nanoarchaeia archaeon]
MANYLKKALFGVGYVFVFSLFGMFAAYLFRLLVARNLSTEQFGLFYAVFSLVTSIHLFRDPGLKYALIKFIPEFVVKGAYEKINKMVSMTFFTWTVVAVLFSAVTIFFAKFLSDVYFKSGDAFWLIVVLSVAFVLILDYVISYAFQGFQKMAFFSSVDALRSLLLLAVAFIGFSFSPGVLVPAFAYLIVPVILSIVYFPILKFKVFKGFALFSPFDSHLLRKMVYFGLPVTITGISYSLFQQSGVLILTYFDSLSEVALLNIALPTSALIINLASSILYVIFPLSSELWALGYKKHLEEGINLLYRYSFMAIIPVSLVMFSFSELLINLFFGEKYAGASLALMVLSIGSIFWVISNINFSFLAGIGRSKEPLKIMMAIGLFGILLNFALIPFFGLMGAVWSIVIGYFLALVFSLVMLKKYVEVHMPIMFWFRNILVGLIFLGSIYAIKGFLVVKNAYLEAIITLIGASAIYVIFLFLLRMTSVQELMHYLGRAIKK